MTIDNKDGAAFLAYVTDKLETRIAHISQSILEGHYPELDTKFFEFKEA